MPEKPENSAFELLSSRKTLVMATVDKNGAPNVSYAPFVRRCTQHLRLHQIARVETFGEPPVNRSDQFARLLRLPPVAPETREANGGA